RILDLRNLPVARQHLVNHRGGGGNEVHLVFALKALLHDVEMEQAKKAAAEAEAQRLRRFGLETQRGVVQVQLLQRLAQRAVFARVHRIEAGEDLRLDFLESGQRL